MTDCYVYVGVPQDPNFHLNGGDWNYNRPKQLSPDFPPLGGAYNAVFFKWVEAAGITRKQTDYGAHVALVSKNQILEFIADGYAGCEDLPWVAPDLPELKHFVNSLDTDKQYALVATEF